MSTLEKTMITVATTIKAPVEKVWIYFTDPRHIVHWSYASDDWHTSWAENELKTGGRFTSRMEARDGSSGFDFGGVYKSVILLKQIRYTMDDGRNVQVSFDSEGNETRVTETFETEHENPPEFQQKGWQAILDNFKKYVEKSANKDILHYEIHIHAGVEKVYNTLIDEKLYTEWTKAFNNDAHFIGSWTKGSKIQFIGEDQNGGTGGVVSRIKENIPNRYISIEHLGMVQNGKEIYDDPKAEMWAGALENYTFVNQNGMTQLVVDVDADKSYKAYFDETWPKALLHLKTICEQ